MDIRETQIRCIQDLARACQIIIARLDELLFKIKALSAAIWSALSGWAITKQNYELLIIATLSLVGLWLVAAAFRGAQKRYICYSDLLHKFLSDAGQLVVFESSGDLPDCIPTSLGGCESRIERAKLWVLGLISPTVSLFYAFFISISISVYFLFL